MDLEFQMNADAVNALAKLLDGLAVVEEVAAVVVDGGGGAKKPAAAALTRRWESDVEEMLRLCNAWDLPENRYCRYCEAYKRRDSGLCKCDGDDGGDYGPDGDDDAIC